MRSRFMRSTNPMFRSIQRHVYASDYPATYAGIAYKTLFLFAITITSAATVVTYQEFFLANYWIFIFSLVAGFVSVMIASFSPKKAVFFAPLYGIFEGIVIGALVAIVSAFAPGIVENAILITLSIFFSMMILYASGAVRVGPFLRRLVMGALMGLVLFSIIIMISSLFSGSLASMYYGNLQFMLIISLVSAAIASLMILLDLDNCTRLVQAGAPKEFEWSASLGLLVTIIWLFIEILRILLIFAARRD